MSKRIDKLAPGVSRELKVSIFKELEEFSEEDQNWFLALIFVESSFRPSVIGDRGKLFGLCQIQIPIAQYVAGRKISKEDLLDPVQNLKIAKVYVKELLKNCSWAETLAIYNSGRKNLTLAFDYLSRIKNSMHLFDYVD